MSRVPPFNLRLTSGNLEFETSGTSIYFFYDQLKQQLSLHNAVKVACGTLKWRLIQSKSRLNQTLQHGLLPLITRLRCKWNLTNKFQQSTMFYENKWAHFGPLIKACNQNDLFWPQKQEFQSSVMLRPHEIKPLLEYKSYKKGSLKRTSHIYKPENRTYTYAKACKDAFKHHLIYQMVNLRCKDFNLKPVNYAGYKSYTWHNGLMFKNIMFYDRAKDRYWNAQRALFKLPRPGVSAAMVFSLFCCALIANNKLKPAKVYSLDERPNHKNPCLNYNLTTYTYSHVSKIALIHKTSDSAIKPSFMEKSRAYGLNIEPKDALNARADLKCSVSYNFNSYANLNLFGFEHREFSKACLQKVYIAKEGVRQYHSKHARGVLNRRTWCIKKAYVPNFHYFSKGTPTSRSTCIRGLNAYINLHFNIRSANMPGSEQHFISDLSLRL